RGYPVESFDDRAALVATDHQDVVEGYRSAHDTFAGHLQGGSTETEALRQAFLHYREVFGRLNVPDGEVRETGDQGLIAAAPARPAAAGGAPGRSRLRRLDDQVTMKPTGRAGGGGGDRAQAGCSARLVPAGRSSPSQATPAARPAPTVTPTAAAKRSAGAAPA